MFYYTMAIPCSVRNYLEDFKKVAIYSIIVMIAIVIALSIIGLIIELLYSFFVDPVPLEDRADFLTFIGNFLVVVIAVELLDTLVLYIQKHKLFPELILMVVLTAVAREVLVTDPVHADPMLLTGIGAILIAIAGSYYLIRRAGWEAADKGLDGGYH